MNRVIQMLMRMLLRRVMARGRGKSASQGGISATAYDLGKKAKALKRLTRRF